MGADTEIPQFYRTEEAEPKYPIASWVWRGCIVLDFHGQPLRHLRNLPATISSNEHGCFLEGMFREDPRTCSEDVYARMPWKVVTQAPTPGSQAATTTYEPGVKYGKITMSRSRFRDYAACIAWMPRDGSDELKAHLEAILPKECLQLNSTRTVSNFMGI